MAQVDVDDREVGGVRGEQDAPWLAAREKDRNVPSAWPQSAYTIRIALIFNALMRVGLDARTDCFANISQLHPACGLTQTKSSLRIKRAFPSPKVVRFIAIPIRPGPHAQ